MLNRNAVFAGRFYPEDARILAMEIDDVLERPAVEVPEGTLYGLIAPHAGIMFSGETAGAAYSLLQDQRIDTAVIIGPSHRAHIRWTSVLDKGLYETPLGSIAVNSALARAIVGDHDTISATLEGHQNPVDQPEHSIEVQLPFLQRILRCDFSIVPVIMGIQHQRNALELANALVEAVQSSEEQVLLIASSDLSHFHSDKKARKLDAKIIEAVEALDEERLWRLIESGEAEACGFGPMMAVMMASRKLGAKNAVSLGYATSAEKAGGSSSSVVGYYSAGFFG